MEFPTGIRESGNPIRESGNPEFRPSHLTPANTIQEERRKKL